jgi:hypothetical protein
VCLGIAVALVRLLRGDETHWARYALMGRVIFVTAGIIVAERWARVSKLAYGGYVLFLLICVLLLVGEAAGVR